MVSLFAFLVTCATLAPDQSSGTIKDSTSPDGQFHFIAIQKEDGIYYRIDDKSETPFSKELQSDFGVLRPLTEVLAHTSIHWRPDGKFVIAFTGHDRHHGDFLILAKTATGFRSVPLDWEKLDDFAHMAPLGFGYPAFLQWRPDGRAVVDLFEFDGRNIIRESTFDVDLTGPVTIVSWKIIKPEQRVKNS